VSWYDTVSPSEHMDSERSSVYARASSKVRQMTGPVTVDVRALAGPNAGWPAVTRDKDELFVLHGSLAFKGFDGAQLSRIDLSTWTITWTTRLLDTRLTPDWSYPGAVGVHKDGFLYVFWSYHAARVDPATGEVLARVVLPTGQEPRDVTYNGFVVLPDGHLVAKSLYRMPGCTENGFRALARGGLVDTASDIVVLEPSTLRIVATVKAPEHLLGRITASTWRGRTYIYAAGKDSVFRYEWANGALSMDPTWGPVRTRQEGESPASAITAADGWIFIQGNAGPAPVPFTIHAISQDDSARVHTVQPFPGHPASFNASKLTVDGENRRMYTTDGLIGKLAAYDFDPERGFTSRWVVDQGSYSFLVLVGEKDERVLVATELLDTWMSWLVRTKLSRLVPWLAYMVAKERVIWRHPDTGDVLARSPELPGGLAIIPGFDGAIFYATVNKGLIRLEAR
jgi:hypothetical protein